MIKFDLRTIVDMISQLTENLSTDAPKEIIHPIKEKDEQPEEDNVTSVSVEVWRYCHYQYEREPPSPLAAATAGASRRGRRTFTRPLREGDAVEQ